MEGAPGLDRFGRFVNRRELDALRPRLEAGERVLYALEAHRERKGLLAATDRRILFLQKGLLRTRVQEWPYAQVRAVRLALDVDDATVTLATRSKGEVAFARARKKEAEAFAQAVKARPPAPGALLDFTPRKPPRTPRQDRLERLDRLLGRGAITRGEYERAKRALLDE